MIFDNEKNRTCISKHTNESKQSNLSFDILNYLKCQSDLKDASPGGGYGILPVAASCYMLAEGIPAPFEYPSLLQRD